MRLRLLFAAAAAAFGFVGGPAGAHDMAHMTMDAAGVGAILAGSD